MRCSFSLEYNGTHFLGSQIQKSSSNTILGTLDRVLKKLNIDSKIIASGRTDKGVHAMQQVCHIDLPAYWSDTKKLHRVLNEMLPPSIRVKTLQEVPDDFHARYGAKRRVYRYIIKECDSNPFEVEFITFLPNFNFEKVQQDIQLFVGRHDFEYFMKSGSDVTSTTRTIYRAFAYRHKGAVVLYFEADGFLRSQIRLMVGALLKLNHKEIQEQLVKFKKHKIKPAPPNGLYLAKIKYV